jgi:hypothetical protein
MPGLNRRGPLGDGPGTGRGLGPCGAAPDALSREGELGLGRGAGRGLGFGGRGHGSMRGRALGQGLGRRMGWFAAGYEASEGSSPLPKSFDGELEARADFLRAELARVEALLVKREGPAGTDATT